MTTLPYKENLEKARKAILDNQSVFDAPDDETQVKIQEQGLMRPRARPDIPETNSFASGLGMGLMQSLQKKEDIKLKEEKASEGPEMLDGFTWGSSDEEGGEPEGGSSSFAARMKKSESGGRSGVQIRTEDGRTMTGSYQFGDARLADYKRANKEAFTTEEFRTSPALQEKVFAWHVADIDRAINKTAGSENFSRDGLRAVAHLGGIGGMSKYVKSGGTHNPSDDFGTSLSTYYNKFK